MSDVALYTVLLLRKNGTDLTAKIVEVHHDEDLAGSGDPNSAFFAMASTGGINTSKVMLMSEFRKKAAQKPWLISLVSREFERAPFVTSKKRVKNLFDRYGRAKIVLRNPTVNNQQKTSEITREPFIEAP